MYRINWKSKITNSEGHGKYVFSLEMANLWVLQLNKEFPEISHWKELDMKSIPELK